MAAVIKVLLSEETIAQQVRVLAREVSAAYSSLVSIARPLVVMPVLKGSLFFGADLLRQLTIPLRLEFLRASSYGLGTVSGAWTSVIPDSALLQDHHLLIVEDIVDTGQTISKIVTALDACHPLSIKVCALLDKPARRSVPVEADFRGFTIADQFVVGYGMDLAERYRELPYIGELDECSF
jgi:hypoxanthine phosphoribosyltransferase